MTRALTGCKEDILFVCLAPHLGVKWQRLSLGRFAEVCAFPVERLGHSVVLQITPAAEVHHHRLGEQISPELQEICCDPNVRLVLTAPIGPPAEHLEVLVFRIAD